MYSILYLVFIHFIDHIHPRLKVNTCIFLIHICHSTVTFACTIRCIFYIFQYDFSLEERVLEWSKSQRENAEAIQQAETERVGNRIQEFSQMPDPQPPPSQQAPGESQSAQATPIATHAGATDIPNPTSAWSGHGETTSTNRPSLNPFMNIGSSILTPMPINQGGQGHARKESGSGKAQTGMIDLKDFENEQDPFENMELKVLNDREELNKMILGVQAMPESSTGPVENGSTSQAHEPSSRSPVPSPVNLKDVDYPELESFDSGQFGIPGQQSVEYSRGQLPGSVNLQTNSHRAFYQSPQPTSTMPYTSQNMPSATFSYNQAVRLPPLPNARYFPQPPVSSTVQNFLAPNASTTSNVGAVGPNQNNTTFTSTGAVYSKQPGDRSFIPFQSFYSRNPFTDGPSGHLATNGQSNSQSTAGNGRETPPLNPLRSARSTPDISGSEDRRLPPLMPSSHTPPPITRSISPSEISSTHSPTRRTKVNLLHYVGKCGKLMIFPRSIGRYSTRANCRSYLSLHNTRYYLTG